MPKNDFLWKIEQAKLKATIAGSNTGTRQAMDAVIIWLHRNGWGKKRLQRPADGTNDVLKEFLPAFLIGMEQEVWQERMDRELRSALGDPDDFKPFRERYPIVPGTDFDHKPKS